jgi:hypothetical protein
MDKFENHIKKQYERQLKPVNPKAAWANFESERLGKEVKRKWIFLIFLIVGLGAVGSVIVYFSFEGLHVSGFQFHLLGQLRLNHRI